MPSNSDQFPIIKLSTPLLFTCTKGAKVFNTYSWGGGKRYKSNVTQAEYTSVKKETIALTGLEHSTQMAMSKFMIKIHSTN